MRKISTNIHSLLLPLLWGTVLLTSCSEDMEMTEDAEVTFVATLSDGLQTRGMFGDGGQVNSLVVGVFDATGINELHRYTYPITFVGNSIEVQLALAKEQTYNLVFWAYCDGCDVYDMTELTAIRMRNDVTIPVTLGEVEKMDAFYATIRHFTATGHTTQRVELVRPLAQVNVGRRDKGAKATFTVKDAPGIFHPFAETNAERLTDGADFTWTFNAIQTEKFTVDGNEYTYLAMGYVFAPTSEVMKKDCALVLTDENGQTSYEGEFPKVVLHAKHRSNILGDFTNTAEQQRQ